MAEYTVGRWGVSDGWLCGEMGGYVGRWVDMQGDGWLCREMVGYVGRWAAM